MTKSNGVKVRYVFVEIHPYCSPREVIRGKTVLIPFNKHIVDYYYDVMQPNQNKKVANYEESYPYGELLCFFVLSDLDITADDDDEGATPDLKTGW